MQINRVLGSKSFEIEISNGRAPYSVPLNQVVRMACAITRHDRQTGFRYVSYCYLCHIIISSERNKRANVIHSNEPSFSTIKRWSCCLISGGGRSCLDGFALNNSHSHIAGGYA